MRTAGPWQHGEWDAPGKLVKADWFDYAEVPIPESFESETIR